MSSVHDKSDNLNEFHSGIKSTVKELLGERDKHGKRWTHTSIAKAGGLSRNQLYAWMGQGPQRLKRLPERDRVIGFYRGVGKSWSQMFRDIGWDAPSEERVLDLPAQTPSETPRQRTIRLIRIRLDQNPPTEERRELETVLVQLQAAERMEASAVAEAEDALRRYNIVRDERPQ